MTIVRIVIIQNLRCDLTYNICNSTYNIYDFTKDSYEFSYEINEEKHYEL